MFQSIQYDNPSGSLVLVKPYNPSSIDFTADADAKKANIKKFVVWGGSMYNCGEGAASELVCAIREKVQNVFYLPQDHKGGRMIRPHYCRGDRTSTMEFPKLRTIGYWGDMGTPLDVNWIVPNLETLCVFHDDRRDLQMFLACWSIDSSAADSADRPARQSDCPKRVLQQCPRLKEIKVCSTPNFNFPESFQVLRRMLPPLPLAWPKIRLLLIARRKTQKEESLIAKLPSSIFDRVLSFCHTPNWRIVDSGIEPKAIVTTTASHDEARALNVLSILTLSQLTLGSG